jgi:hypothetical protein
MEKIFKKVLQVSLENLLFTSQKILKHHGKKISKSSPGEFRKFIFHKSKNLKTLCK